MIDRQHGKIFIECDSCSDTFEGEKGDEWSEVWPAAATRRLEVEEDRRFVGALFPDARV